MALKLWSRRGLFPSFCSHRQPYCALGSSNGRPHSSQLFNSGRDSCLRMATPAFLDYITRRLRRIPCPQQKSRTSRLPRGTACPAQDCFLAFYGILDIISCLSPSKIASSPRARGNTSPSSYLCFCASSYELAYSIKKPRRSTY